MTRFSANLGFLWTELSLPQAIHAAHRAGFDAVECHWPYDTPAADVRQALAETGLTMLGLNTSRGATDKSATGRGENGLSALPGREAEARTAIDQAVAYAGEIGAQKIHVMAGFASGDPAHASFVSNLRYACEEASQRGISILIEPLNKYDAPGYFLNTSEQAKSIIAEVGADNLQLMFDCYHIQLMEGDLSHRLEQLQGIIGHIQFASVPDRGAPDHGEVNYAHIFNLLDQLGYAEPLGAEYKPGGDTEATLGWLKTMR